VEAAKERINPKLDDFLATYASPRHQDDMAYKVNMMVWDAYLDGLRDGFTQGVMAATLKEQSKEEVAA
jgi:hypothetical protein